MLNLAFAANGQWINASLQTFVLAEDEAPDVSAIPALEPGENTGSLRVLVFNDKNTFGYVGDRTQLTWTVTPENATNPKIAFSSASALTLNGTFVVEPDDPSVKIPVGARWAVGTIAASAGSLGRLWFAHAGNWHVYAEGDATDGWTIYAEKTAPGLSIVVR